jgi:hypothetical protein
MKYLDVFFELATAVAILLLVVITVIGVILMCITASWLWIVVPALMGIVIGGLLWRERLTDGED